MRYYRFVEYDEFDIIFAGERKLTDEEIVEVNRIMMYSEGSPVMRFFRERADYIEELTIYLNSKRFNIIKTEVIS
jgi:hypothetical protein